MQALFEIDTVGHDPGITLRERLATYSLPTEGEAFCRSLVGGVLEQQAALDKIIQEIAPERPIDQMAPVDRNILRLAAFELLAGRDTPPKVAINEAVELAKMFGSDSSGRFVNGVLGTLLADRHRLQERLGSSVASAAAAAVDESSVASQDRATAGRST